MRTMNYLSHGPLQIGNTTLNQGSTFAFPPLIITLVENQNKHNILQSAMLRWQSVKIS